MLYFRQELHATTKEESRVEADLRLLRSVDARKMGILKEKSSEAHEVRNHLRE